MADTIKIRPGNNVDIVEIRLMMKKLFLKWDKIDPIDKIDHNWFNSKSSDSLIRNRINNLSSKYYVASEYDRLIGYIYGTIQMRPESLSKGIGVVEELYIQPDYRKKNVGKKLTKQLIKWFKTRNVKWSIVLVHSKDKNANSYWKRMKYRDYNRKYKLKI